MKLWGGRFAKATDADVHAFNASLSFDRRLYEQDIRGSVAWARALVGAGVVTPAEAEQIVLGLEQVRRELQAERFQFHPADEDIHTAVERRLIEIVGDVGGKLHTGRSRNDQVATDFRLWLMEAIDQVVADVSLLQQRLVESASAHLDLPMPGYTHLQHAQPVTWGHWVLSHFWPLERDVTRLQQARAAAAVLPLGAAALAGTAFAVDRAALVEELGFVAVSQNSLDAVSDRDFVADFLYAAVMIGIHLSRLAEQLILFSSAEFSFVSLDDAYSTGSSLMPQKKNPDTLELTRGKSGRLLGHLTGLLATLKGLPSSYDKDLQEDKEPVFDAFDTLTAALPVMAGLVETLRLRPEKMAAQLDPGLLATDLADYLVKRGVPFRQAHGLIGQLVRSAEEKGLALDELVLDDFQAVSSLFEADVVDVLSVQHALSSRAVPGGTAPESVKRQVNVAQTTLKDRQSAV
ncbi:MAG: argininosuccinate lyase [Candidatus Promineifilaceae bacterium]|nr:argininosuccinate lyase [Candidatus Promineifilaceae bacterium]